MRQWFVKGGARVDGKTTIDQWAHWFAKHIVKNYPDKMEDTEISLRREETATDKHGRVWDVILRIRTRITWAKRRPPES